MSKAEPLVIAREALEEIADIRRECGAGLESRGESPYTPEEMLESVIETAQKSLELLDATGATPPSLLEVLSLAEATIVRLNRHDSANGTLEVVRDAIARMGAPPRVDPSAARLHTALECVAHFVGTNENEMLFCLRSAGEEEIALELFTAMKEWRDAGQAFLESIATR